MNTDKNIGSELAKASLDQMPTPKTDAKEIVGLVKSNGRISGYQLSDGTKVTREQGVSMAKSGDIINVGISHRKDTEYLKSIPDGEEGNNLGSLPTVSK